MTSDSVSTTKLAYSTSFVKIFLQGFAFHYKTFVGIPTHSPLDLLGLATINLAFVIVPNFSQRFSHFISFRDYLSSEPIPLCKISFQFVCGYPKTFIGIPTHSTLDLLDLSTINIAFFIVSDFSQQFNHFLKVHFWGHLPSS